MSFAGAVSAMIASLRQNRNILKAGKHDSYDQWNRTSAKSRKWVDPVQLSKEEMDVVIERIRNERRKERKKEVRIWLISGIMTILFLVATYMILAWRH